ncbi:MULTISPECIES: hypothetical protein [unclassified Fibrobacter]|uniref:hypothetical protein n=1 Tax=unclassified Fibrobacter TaxID=2634177 RepID=UPI001114D5F6|nr:MULTISPECIES: hypothetical protein [unclassified Fibrobacter]
MKNRITKDPFVIAYAMVIAVCSVICLVATLKIHSLPELGYVINDDFLKLLVQYENYEIIQDSSAVLAVTFGIAICIYIALKYKFPRFEENHKKWNLACSLIVFPVIGFFASIAPNLDFPTRLKAEPRLHKEFVVDKYKSHGSKSGTSYHLLFNSGSSFMVGSKKFNAAFNGQEFYTVYQGNTLIQIFSPDRYRLAEDY